MLQDIIMIKILNASKRYIVYIKLFFGKARFLLKRKKKNTSFSKNLNKPFYHSL